jgi:hypothetical protein
MFNFSYYKYTKYKINLITILISNFLVHNYINILYSNHRIKELNYSIKNSNIAQLKNDIIENVMLLWTNLDLLRSITINEDQKEKELNYIATNLLEIYSMLFFFKNHINILIDKEDTKDDENLYISKELLIDIYKSIKENFLEIFKGLQQESSKKLYSASLFILKKIEKIIDEL